MTAIVLKTGKSYAGNRKAIDLSDAYLEPSKLFNSYKSRVIADGGKIINEPRLLAEITTMVAEGLWGTAAAWISASFGVKTDSSGAVIRAYGLAGSPDFVPEAVGKTVQPVMLDTTMDHPIFVVRLDKGGSFLKSEKKIFAQRIAGKDFAFSVRGTDILPYPDDSIGIAVSVAHPTTVNPLLVWNLIDGFNTRLQWSYTSTATVPVSSGSTITVNKTPYSPFKQSAALISPTNGKLSVYTEGTLASSGSHASGKLANLNGIGYQINIGPFFNDPAAWATNTVCYGGISSIRLLSDATESQAKILSMLL